LLLATQRLRSGDVIEAIRKADVLIEALAYIRKFHGRFTVIKLGGSVMEDTAALQALLVDIVFMQTVGMRPVVVHGGGKAISAAMAQANLQPHFVQGRRYTDEATLKIVADVLTNGINADIVRHIKKFGGRAAGLHALTTQCLYGRPITLTGPDGQPVDLGRVGEVDEVDVLPIENLCVAGVVPVLPSLAESQLDDRLLNVNADTAAAAVARHLQADKLVFLTDMPGILRDRNDPASLIQSLNPAECRELIDQGVVDSGMIPKIEACLESLAAGVRKVHIIDGRLPHALLLEIFTDQGIGTLISADPVKANAGPPRPSLARSAS
jgi:acetylglutamate kinase